jgi:MFS family permease
MLAVLRQRNFALLWFGQLISLTGDFVLLVALPFYTYQITGSALATGLMFLIQALPSLFLGSLAGVFVDRWNRRWIMIIADLSRALILLPLLFVHSRNLLWVIYLVALIEQTISQFFIPAKGAIIPNLVEEQHLLPANALNSTSDAITRLIGPPLGGAILAIFGLSSVVLIDSTSYFISGIMLLLILMPAHPSQEKSETLQSTTKTSLAKVWYELLTGLRLVVQERFLTALFVIVSVIMLSQGIINALIVVFVKAILHGNATTFGLLMTFQGIGTLIGSVFIGQLGKRLQPVYLIMLGTTPTGFVLLILLNIPNLLLTFALITIIGLLVVGFFITEQTLLQNNVADQYRGRVLGAYAAISSLLNIIGIAIGGVLGDILGVVGALDIAAILFGLSGLIAFTMLRRATTDESAEAALEDIEG